MPSSRSVLTASALFLGAIGLALLFVPVGSALAIGLDASASEGVALAAPALLGMAALDWIGRGLRVGGIYGRPLSVANVMTGAVGTSTLARMLSDEGGTPVGWLVVTALALHTVLFAILMVRGGLDDGPVR